MRPPNVIDIGRDFSEVPGGRFPSDGDANGERFRVDFLVPSLRRLGPTEVIVDNTEGFGSSFLEEAFGGLIRKEGFTKSDLVESLIITARTKRAERYKRKIWEYIDKAEAQRSH